jgi:DNA polymerase III subunit epsilon
MTTTALDSFVALDVETANADLASICQIGVVAFEGAAVRDEWEVLVDPEDFFEGWNTAIHGITEEDVRGAPTFSDHLPELSLRLGGHIVVTHTPFDRVALSQSAERYTVACPECSWLDSARVVRRAWPDRYAKSGYGLENVAGDLGIEYEAHRAVEDARAAGLILLKAVEATGMSVEEWVRRARRPIHLATVGRPIHIANPEGPLYGEVICFTGALLIPRREAAALAAQAGCIVANGVTRSTTLLVVGNPDARKLAGHVVSAKHSKAEHLISQGYRLRIVTESDFERIVSLSSLPASVAAS